VRSGRCILQHVSQFRTPQYEYLYRTAVSCDLCAADSRLAGLHVSHKSNVTCHSTANIAADLNPQNHPVYENSLPVMNRYSIVKQRGSLFLYQTQGRHGALQADGCAISQDYRSNGAPFLCRSPTRQASGGPFFRRSAVHHASVPFRYSSICNKAQVLLNR
jgi:hypothetical protein